MVVGEQSHFGLVVDIGRIYDYKNVEQDLKNLNGKPKTKQK